MEEEYFNSIITSHRGRKGSVRSFFRSLLLSSKHIDRNSFEVIVADLDTDQEVDRIIDEYKKHLNINHCKINYTGLFWKSKALNHCASKAKGKYITMLDIDAIVTPHFLLEVEKFYKEVSREKVKLAYRVRFLDSVTSKQATKNKFDEEFVNGLIARQSKFRKAFERYTKNEIKLRKMSSSEKKWMMDEALGNSHYTMRKEDFMAIGGYDERFIGWACEDLDFNRRAFEYLRHGTLLPTPVMTVFSTHHERTGWLSRASTLKNERLYAKNKQDKVIQLPIDDTWGKF